MVSTFLFFVCFLLTGCDLFSTRDPESPGTNRAGFTTATAPRTVITNLQSAISSKNVVYYTACLIDTSASTERFRFEPAQNADPAKFLNWTAESEGKYFTAMANAMPSESSWSLFLSDTTPTQSSTSQAEYSGTYFLNLQHSNSTLPQSARGTISLILTRDVNGIWGISKWTDASAQSDTSWSQLKARFRD